MKNLKEKIIHERQKAVEKQGVKRKNENFVPPTQSEPGKYVRSPYKVVAPSSKLIINSKDSDIVLEKDSNLSNRESAKRTLFNSTNESEYYFLFFAPFESMMHANLSLFFLLGSADSSPGKYARSPKKMKSDYQTLVTNALRPPNNTLNVSQGMYESVFCVNLFYNSSHYY